ncbi:MAG: ATP-binding protein [Firmicutes bacterium]|nr:ATP-binding protein [Bacillota bacterium]
MLMSIPNKDIIFEPFENPRGKKKIEYPLKDLYAIYIGDDKDIIEVSICKKETDENGNVYYLDLLTKNNYIPNDTNEIKPIKIFTLTSLLPEERKNTILRDGFITNFDLIDLYNDLNTDTEYETYTWKYEGAEYKAPTYAKTYEWIIPLLDEEENELTELIASIRTNPKPVVIYGDNGIGKTTLVDKLLYYAKNDSTYIDINKIFMMDYLEMLNKTKTIKHVKNRIKKALEFLKNINCNLLVIDNIDMKDTFFLETLTTLSKDENIGLVLVASKKKDIDLNNSKYRYIEVTETKEYIKRSIFEFYLNKIEKDKKYKINYSKEDIIDILIDLDKISSNNMTNTTKNPKLGMQIIYNAFLISSSKNIKRKKDKVISKKDFIEALDQKNINMDPKTKEEIKERFKNLEEKQKRKTFLKYLKRVNY